MSSLACICTAVICMREQFFRFITIQWYPWVNVQLVLWISAFSVQLMLKPISLLTGCDVASIRKKSIICSMIELAIFATCTRLLLMLWFRAMHFACRSYADLLKNSYWTNWNVECSTDWMATVLLRVVLMVLLYVYWSNRSFNYWSRSDVCVSAHGCRVMKLVLVEVTAFCLSAVTLPPCFAQFPQPRGVTRLIHEPYRTASVFDIVVVSS